MNIIQLENLAQDTLQQISRSKKSTNQYRFPITTKFSFYVHMKARTQHLVLSPYPSQTHLAHTHHREFAGQDLTCLICRLWEAVKGLHPPHKGLLFCRTPHAHTIPVARYLLSARTASIKELPQGYWGAWLSSPQGLTQRCGATVSSAPTC